MTDLEIENEESFVDVKIWKIPKADFDFWMQIVRAYAGNRQIAFRTLLDAYHTLLVIGKLHGSIQSLEDRVQTLEQKWQKDGGNFPKTFGGSI